MQIATAADASPVYNLAISEAIDRRNFAWDDVSFRHNGFPVSMEDSREIKSS
jgi:hypothetical protein